MLFKCMFSGSGGQGSALMAKMVCEGAIRQKLKVVMTQSYGIEQRGGDSTAFVIISDEAIGNTIIENDSDIAVALSISMYNSAFEGTADGGTLFCNSSLIKEFKETDKFTQVTIPVSTMAVDFGSVRCANMIMLGAIIEKTGMLKMETIEAVLTEMMGKKKPALLEMNLKAFHAGCEAAQKG